MKLEEPIREALKSIEKLHFHLEKNDTGITRIATKPLQRKKTKVKDSKIIFGNSISFFKDKTGPDYLPKAMDFNSVTMNREMQVQIFFLKTNLSKCHSNCKGSLGSLSAKRSRNLGSTNEKSFGSHRRWSSLAARSIRSSNRQRKTKRPQILPRSRQTREHIRLSCCQVKHEKNNF